MSRCGAPSADAKFMFVKDNSQRKWLPICLEFVNYMYFLIHFIHFKIAARKVFQAISNLKDETKVKQSILEKTDSIANAQRNEEKVTAIQCL